MGTAADAREHPGTDLNVIWTSVLLLPLRSHLTGSQCDAIMKSIWCPRRVATAFMKGYQIM
jgi:hypothetical protein